MAREVDTSKIFLVDMDGVVADFEGGFITAWQQKYPGRPYVPLGERKTFKLTDDYPLEMVEDVKKVYCTPGFFGNLPVIPGAVEAIQEMHNCGHEIFFCTSPLSSWENCVGEKHAWIEHTFGREWVRKIILTKDKTLINGDLLIDDNPELHGVRFPSWEHVIFDAPYNRGVIGKRRFRFWSEWKELL